MKQTSGSRVRAIRSFCVSSRHEFCEQTGLSESTLKAWENNISPLTEKGAVLLVKIFTRQGIFCTQNWLLHGEGLSPIRQLSEVSDRDLSEEESILQEIEALKKCYQKQQLIVMNILDNEMGPYYKTADFVLGVKIKVEKLRNFIGHPLIFETKEHGVILRTLEKESIQQGLELGSLSLAHKFNTLKLDHSKIKSVYQILWYRRKLETL